MCAPHREKEISILVVGGGISGLFCALECQRHGFSPIILESRGPESTAGDFITIGPSALQAFKRNSTRLADDVYKKAFHPTSTWYQPTGKVGAGPRPFQKNFGLVITRPRLYEALATAVREASIEVRYHKRIHKYFEIATQAGVETDDGEVLKADLIIAADGVHSRSWEVVTGSPPRAYSSGSAVFRAAFPAEQARHNEIIRSKWLLGEDQLSFYIGPDSHAIVVTSSDIITWVWMHSDKFQTSSESWTETLSSDEALHQLKDAGLEAPELQELIRVTPPNTIVDWQLVWRDLDEDWVSSHARIVQIGDAAHPFLPTSVNGGTQALEDATSLPVCLSIAMAKCNLTTAEAITQASRVHNRLRFERVCCIQRSGIQRKQAYRTIDWEAARRDPSVIENAPPPWMTYHSPEAYARQHFEECAACLRRGGRFKNANIPPDFIYTPTRLIDLDPSLQDLEKE